MATRDEILAALTGPGGPFELRSTAAGDRDALPVYVTGPQTLREVLLASAGYDDATFLVYEGERISHREHFARAARLAHWLTGRGIAKGDRVAIGMRNYPEWSTAFFACQAIGAVAVTLNAWWTGPELRYGLEDSGSRMAFLDGERYQALAGELDGLELQVVVTRGDGTHADTIAWADLLGGNLPDDRLPEAVVEATDSATILYTSGTTGRPKGALHSHRNHVTNLQNTLLNAAVAAALVAPDPDAAVAPPQPVSLQTFPFFHIGGLSGLYLSAFTGARLVLMYRWDVERAIELISQERVRSWSGVPTVVRQLLEHPRAGGGELASLASIASGGAPVPEDLIRRVGRQFADRVAPGNGYGATETTSAVIVNGGADYLARPHSVGRPVATARVRVVDESLRDCEAGEIGELWVQGPNVFQGYWQRPDATVEAFHDGWFKTGDLAYRDDEGFYTIVDRKKDVVIRGGENVYCAEVEGVLHEHPDVADVAIIGLPHRALGEEVVAVVEPRAGAALTEAQLQQAVAARLARYNVPSRVIFVHEPLPRTATGKVLKRALKERFST